MIQRRSKPPHKQGSWKSYKVKETKATKIQRTIAVEKQSKSEKNERKENLNPGREDGNETLEWRLCLQIEEWQRERKDKEDFQFWI